MAKKDDSWSLAQISAGIRGAGERREAERAEFNAKLGEPHHFVPYPDGPEGHGMGYWRIEGGIVAYRRYSNGYDPMTRVEYTDQFILMLNNLQILEPRHD